MPKIIKKIIGPPTQILHTPMLLHFLRFKYFRDSQHIPSTLPTPPSGTRTYGKYKNPGATTVCVYLYMYVYLYHGRPQKIIQGGAMPKRAPIFYA